MQMSPGPAAPETNANDSFRWYGRHAARFSACSYDYWIIGISFAITI